MEPFLIEHGKIWVDCICETCEGTGRTAVREYCSSHPHYLFCDWTDEEKANDQQMPCGCDYARLRSEDYCEDCDGSGKAGQFISVKEFMVCFLKELLETMKSEREKETING